MTTDAKDSAAGKSGAGHETVEIIKTVVYALLIALVLRVLLFQPYTIPSASMEPNLYQGDYIIVSKFSYGWSRYSIPFSPPLFSGRLFFHSPQRGDVVVFKLPRDVHMDYIKRLIGLPGDRIQVRSGQVFINDQPVPRQSAGEGVGEEQGTDQAVQRFWETLPNGRRYLVNSFQPGSVAENTAVYVVPPHCYFMMGDNRDNSLDSRFDPVMPVSATGAETCGWDSSVDLPGADEAGVGFVPEENLEGKAQLILMSWKPGASLFKPWTWFSINPDRFFRSLG
jgi:signal peptidase I